jgi:FOG: CheY-like receiver
MNWSDKSILIAEDEDTNYMLLSEYLEPTGAKIFRAHNGLEVIELYHKTSIDLLLLDMKMPMMSGFEAVRKIRENDDKLPIIAQTAYAMAGDKERIILAGCNDYIAKPIKENVLFDKINAIFK